ncbi:MAG TPA: HIT domain-containing protein [Candidatus Ozemobacteraceae bacterium]|nr:HIT domain-containing protein [Candidatus Ozemobacteraceae bacterium]
MTFKRQLYIPGKRDYIKGQRRPDVGCILCAILDGNARVDRLMIWEDELFVVSANLYPYNAGHLLLFPRRHILDPRELTPAEVTRMAEVQSICLDALDKVYEPAGYNIGSNIGEASGASIEHLHQHIVPRYPKELGFVDICAGAKIIIEDPHVTMEKLRAAIAPRLTPPEPPKRPTARKRSP